MYQKNPTKKSKIRFFIIALGVIASLGAIAFALEKTGVTNFYSTVTEPTNTGETLPTGEVPSANPVNTVDYSPSKNEDSVPVADKSINPAQPLPTNPDLAVVITNSRKSGNLYLIKAVISGTDSATCKATMTNGTSSASSSSGAGMIEGQYSCKDLSIPMSQLTQTGEWNLELTVTDKTGATASTNEKVIL